MLLPHSPKRLGPIVVIINLISVRVIKCCIVYLLNICLPLLLSCCHMFLRSHDFMNKNIYIYSILHVVSLYNHRNGKASSEKTCSLLPPFITTGMAKRVQKRHTNVVPRSLLSEQRKTFNYPIGAFLEVSVKSHVVLLPIRYYWASYVSVIVLECGFNTKITTY